MFNTFSSIWEHGQHKSGFESFDRFKQSIADTTTNFVSELDDDTKQNRAETLVDGIMHAITKKEADTMKYLLAGPVDKPSTGMTILTVLAVICSMVYVFSGLIYYFYNHKRTDRSIVGRVFYFPLELCLRLICVFTVMMGEPALYIVS